MIEKIIQKECFECNMVFAMEIKCNEKNFKEVEKLSYKRLNDEMKEHYLQRHNLALEYS